MSHSWELCQRPPVARRSARLASQNRTQRGRGHPASDHDPAPSEAASYLRLCVLVLWVLCPVACLLEAQAEVPILTDRFSSAPE